MIEITIKTEYITLGQFLKYVGIIANGSEAKNFIENHKILLNGEVITQRGKKIYPSDIVIINENEYLIKG